MKISIDKLREGLSLVSPAVAKRATLPVLKHVLLKIEDEQMTFGANNLETAIGYTVSIVGGDPVGMTVPFKLLSDYVKTLTDEMVELTIDEKRATLKLETDKEEANIKGLSAEEFPGMPEVTGDSITFSQAALEFLAARVVFAASTDESRPILTGILTEFEDHHIRMAAADGFRLSQVDYTQDWPSEKISVVIPANVFGAVDKLCSACPDEKVEAVLGEDRISFKVGDAVLVTQLIESAFPDYAKIIPTEHTVEVVLDDVVPFWQAVKTIGLFADDNIMQLTIGDNLIKLKAVSAEDGEGEAEIETETVGELEIGVSSKYLEEVLGVMKGGGQVEVFMKTPTAPLLFVQGDGFKHVIMPMNIVR